MESIIAAAISIAKILFFIPNLHFLFVRSATCQGAIISMPLRAEGMKKGRAFWGGVLSGIVEPIGAVLTILAAGIVVPALPYLLSFAAGAMLYVVVEELIPEMSQGQHSNVGTVFFAVGFSVMMVLDVALG
jgi:ZIP family zinc transporter